MVMSDPLRVLPGYLLRRASSAALADLNRRLEEVGLRHAEASLLVLLAANPGTTQSALGRQLDIQRANMAPLVARLDARGFISRKPVDGRSEGLHLTPAGERSAADALAAMTAHEAALLEGGRRRCEFRRAPARGSVAVQGACVAKRCSDDGGVAAQYAAPHLALYRQRL